MNKVELIAAVAEKAGMTKVDARKAVDAIIVPESCIVYSNDSTFVYKDNIKTPVKTGLSDGVNIVVTEGLQSGDKIRGNEIFK